MTVNHSLGAFLRGCAVDAVEIDGLNKIAVAANMLDSAPLRLLLRRMKVAVEPTARVVFHRVARNNHRVSTTALLAIERAIFEA